MKRMLAVAAVLFALAGCSDQLGDRGGDEGAAPDKISDVDYIEVFRNADNFPNVAMVCVRGIAFAATSREGMSAPSLLRVPEWDARRKTVSPGMATLFSEPRSVPVVSEVLAHRYPYRG